MKKAHLPSPTQNYGRRDNGPKGTTLDGEADRNQGNNFGQTANCGHAITKYGHNDNSLAKPVLQTMDRPLQ